MIIDFHMHMPTGIHYENWHVPNFLQMMDDAGIDKGVIFTIDGFFTDVYPESNDLLYERAMQCPERLIPFCSVNPKQGKVAVDEVRRCLSELNMKGIKIHPWLQGVSIFFPVFAPICELAIEYDVPILFHDGTPPNSSPLQIAHLAEQFPSCKIVLGHGGLFDLWQEVIWAVKRNPNIYVCLCGTSPQGILSKIISAVPADRLLFGTDAGFGKDPYVPKYRVDHIQRIEMEELKQQGLLSQTAISLLKLNSWG